MKFTPVSTGLLAGLTALATASGCHLIKVNGKPLGGGSNNSADNQTSDSSGESAQSNSRAGDTAPSAPAIQVTSAEPLPLAADFGPNPISLNGTGGSATLPTKKLLGKSPSGCHGYFTPDPTAVVAIDSAMDKATLTAPGAEIVLAIAANGTYRCREVETYSEQPAISLAGWTGNVEVYVGRQSIREPVTTAFTIEDNQRPRTLPSFEGTPEVALTTSPKKAQLLAVELPARPRTPRGAPSCIEGRFRDAPDVVVRVKTSILKLDISAHSVAPIRLMVVGPIPESGRDLPRSCADGTLLRFSRLEPGVYHVRIGTGGQPAAATVMLRHTEGTLDPLAIAPHIPDNLTLVQRNVTEHFPMLERDDVWNSDGLRQQLFLHAPASLFVFPKLALDAERATFVPRVGDRSNDHAPPEGQATDFPKANEPLLTFAPGIYLSADGNTFEIHSNDLALAPSGPIYLPKQARNPGLSDQYSHQSVWKDGTKSERKVVARGEQDFKKLDQCKARVWKPVDRKIDALLDGPYSAARQERINSLKRTTRDKVYTKCGQAAYDKRQNKIHQELMVLRTKRRSAMLPKLRERLTKLFGN